MWFLSDLESKTDVKEAEDARASVREVISLLRRVRLPSNYQHRYEDPEIEFEAENKAWMDLFMRNINEIP